ncbi:MAG: PTS sugar transporter subunit IIA [Deltaproteobacteria bacterium]|nr:PTS sugar transporter subunit IIA [Deltaproteobacteria bacterium]
MRVSDVLSKECVIPELKARTKHEALAEMSAALASRVGGLDGEGLLERLLERERLGSTGIGYGVAIPHAKVKGIDAIVVGFARSSPGVDFQSTDKMPVHLFFLIVAPEHSTAAHLKVLAAISRLLKDNGLRNALTQAATGDDIYRVIMEGDWRMSLRNAVI